MKIEAKNRQSLVDLALQVCGSLDAVLVLAERNGLSVTDELYDGQILEYELSDVTDKSVVSTYAREQVYPATALTEDELSKVAQEGINFMGIEFDFIVS